MASTSKPRYVDLSNPSLAIECPKCGLETARFSEQCRNCGFKLWPSGPVASAAFRAWRDAEPSRAEASRFDTEVPVEVDTSVDYLARAHELGIHVFPNSNWPFIICFGFMFLGLAAIPWDSSALRITFAVIGAVIFLWGVAGWVVVEDSKIFPSDAGTPGHEVHH